ncbi:MAG: peptidoglycan DD-metalloendopeptidase family protein [Mariprofundales bacterium]
MMWRVRMVLALVLLAVCAAGWSYNDAKNHALQRTQAEVLLQHQQAVAVYQRDIANLQQIKQDQQTRLGYLTRNIGALEARMDRLDALGERLVDAASLDPQLFSFDHQPAIGGVEHESLALVPPDIHLEQEVDAMLQGSGQLTSALDSIDFYLMLKQDKQQAKPHLWPSAGGWLSSRYGRRVDPFSGRVGVHHGVDIANRLGADVTVAASGVVLFAGKDGSYGHLVVVDHGYGYRTRYAHLHDTVAHAGDVVEAGAIIGHIGTSGRSTGPHLHFEVHYHGRHLNPAHFLPRHHS